MDNNIKDKIRNIIENNTTKNITDICITNADEQLQESIDTDKKIIYANIVGRDLYKNVPDFEDLLKVTKILNNLQCEINAKWHEYSNNKQNNTDYTIIAIQKEGVYNTEEFIKNTLHNTCDENGENYIKIYIIETIYNTGNTTPYINKKLYEIYN